VRGDNGVQFIFQERGASEEVLKFPDEAGKIGVNASTKIVGAIGVGVGVDKDGIGVHFVGPRDAKEVGKFGLKLCLFGLPIVAD